MVLLEGQQVSKSRVGQSPVGKGGEGGGAEREVGKGACT